MVLEAQVWANVLVDIASVGFHVEARDDFLL